jgi:DNA repair protein RadC
MTTQKKVAVIFHLPESTKAKLVELCRYNARTQVAQIRFMIEAEHQLLKKTDRNSQEFDSHPAVKALLREARESEGNGQKPGELKP